MVELQRLLRSNQELEQALEEVDELWDASPGSPEHDRLDVLLLLVEAYERKNFPIDPPTPADAVKFRMEQQGLSVTDLQKLLGPELHIAEFLEGTRPLTLRLMRKLHQILGISADVLLASTPRSDRSARSRRSLRLKPSGI